MAARLSGDLEDSLALLSQAVELLETAGLKREAARVDGLAASALQQLGRFDEAWERIDRAYAAVDDGSDDDAMAMLAASKSSIAFMGGDLDAALDYGESALRIADGRRLDSILVTALITKANVLSERGRPAESTALLTHAVKLAVEQDLGEETGRAYYNLAENEMAQGHFAEAEEMLTRALERARRRGDRPDERRQLAQRLIALTALGRWDDLLSDAREVTEHAEDIWSAQTSVALPVVLAARGDKPGLTALAGRLGRTGWTQVAQAERVARAVIERETGASAGALAAACEAVSELVRGGSSEVPPLFAEVVDCAFAAGETARVEELLTELEGLKPAQLIPLLEAEGTRAWARLATQREEHARADELFRRATQRFRELDTPFYLARALLEHSELLAHLGQDGRALREEAVVVFEALAARPWLERARRLETAVAA
jgi:tetratricopeptide (TPR) repeat protein